MRPKAWDLQLRVGHNFSRDTPCKTNVITYSWLFWLIFYTDLSDSSYISCVWEVFRTTASVPLNDRMWVAFISSLVLGAGLATAAPEASWSFELQNATSGILALEAIVVSPTVVVWFDRATDDPLQINNHSAWGALWDLETSTVQPLDLITNTFCGSGALLSNGTMVGYITTPIPCNCR